MGVKTDVLVISPHLDDAVLSAGGWIAELTRAGRRVTVFTVFAGVAAGPYSPVASHYHQTWGLGNDPVSHRRAEDLRALGRLGAEVMHGDFLDAIYRTDLVGRWIVDVGTDPSEYSAGNEPELTSQVSQAVRALILSLEPELLLTCVSVGDHVDHVHTCEATRAAAAATGVRLRMWSDLPYECDSVRVLPDSVHARIGPYRPQPFPLSEHAWQAKMRAVGEYASQHSMLWPDITDIDRALHEEASNVGAVFEYTTPCEVLWEPVRSENE